MLDLDGVRAADLVYLRNINIHFQSFPALSAGAVGGFADRTTPEGRSGSLVFEYWNKTEEKNYSTAERSQN